MARDLECQSRGHREQNKEDKFENRTCEELETDQLCAVLPLLSSFSDTWALRHGGRVSYLGMPGEISICTADNKQLTRQGEA